MERIFTQFFNPFRGILILDKIFILCYIKAKKV